MVSACMGAHICNHAHNTLMSLFHFISQVTLRQNFAVPDSDIIANIKDGLMQDAGMQDAGMQDEFARILPAPVPPSTGVELYPLFVKRMSSLHGNECAAQLMERLSTQKRQQQAQAGAKTRQQVNAKYEALRAAKKKKRMELKNVHVHDLTTTSEASANFISTEIECISTASDCSVVTSSPKLAHSLGDEVTALEGTGASTQLLNGVVVEVDLVDGVYIICCRDVHGYINGYNMTVPFEESCTRINQPVHMGKRKRKAKAIYDPDD